MLKDDKLYEMPKGRVWGQKRISKGWLMKRDSLTRRAGQRKIIIATKAQERANIEQASRAGTRLA